MYLKKLSVMLIIVVIISFLASAVNIVNIISKRDWVKIDATVTSILLPDGTICGDFTSDDGVIYYNEPLFSDFRFQQIGALKSVDSEKTDEYIGEHINILYNSKTHKAVSYGNMIRNTIVSIIAFVASVVLAVVCHKIGEKRYSDGN